MPRLWIEYHPSLEPYLNKEAMLEELLAACQVPTVNPSLIKARFFCPEMAVLGPWAERHEGVYLFVLFEWLEGRSSEIEAELVKGLRETLEKHTQEAKKHFKKLSVTFEIQKIPQTQHYSL